MVEVSDALSGPVLIIGAGVAGMTAAIELADSGIKTILVEKKQTIGGNALELYKAFPTDDCFYCFEGSRFRPGIRKCFYRSAMLDNPNIDLKTNTRVEEITGSPGKFKVRLSTGPMYVDPKKCIMCGLCLKRSNAFSMISPQCQPQAVVYDPTLADEGVKEVEEECPTKAINLDAQSTETQVEVSDIILATGYTEMRPVDMDEYGYGKYPNVITQLELARMLDPNGESEGALLRPSDGVPVKRVMMVQCVGSRDENYNLYCSKICCVFALKHANIIVNERGDIETTVVYMDIRTYDRHERYYREAREGGVRFVRGRVHLVKPNSDGSLDVTVYDSLLDRYLLYNIDLFVLSTALEPHEEDETLQKALGLSRSSGFVAPSDLVHDSEVVASNHVYVCGAAMGPAEVPESVTQARAVVSRILQGRQ